MPPLPEGWRSQTAMIASHGASYAGDFLVADLREERRLEMILVDVCGKGTSRGPPALQFAGALGGLIGALPPAELMSAANDFLLRQESDESFATAVHLLVDLDTGDYTITSAGHPPALRWDLGPARVGRSTTPAVWRSACCPTPTAPQPRSAAPRARRCCSTPTA